MAINFDNPYSANLIGLWDFRPGAETNDTGLDDGIAQDGTPVNSPDFTAGWMFTGRGNDQRLDVDDGDDGEFDLDEGTIITRFRQFEPADDGVSTIVSRGIDDSGNVCFARTGLVTSGANQLPIGWLWWILLVFSGSYGVIMKVSEDVRSRPRAKARWKKNRLHLHCNGPRQRASTIGPK